MRRILSLILTALIWLAAAPLGVSAEDGVYYARITSFTAVYDEHTQKVEFEVGFDGSIIEAEEFVVRIYCSVLEPQSHKWEENQSINIYQLSYGSCLREGNRLVGTLNLDAVRFYSENYKDFRISVSGKTVESGGNLYYTLDSGDIPISPKAEYNGEAPSVTARVLPASTAVGGYVMLKLSVNDIPASLSGGLTSLSFGLSYDSAVLRPDEVLLNSNGEGWSLSYTLEEGVLGLALEGGGVYEDGDLQLSFKFMTLAGGDCDFALSEFMGGDGYGHSFSLASLPLSASVRVEAAPTPIGDVNGDGRVDNLDAAWVLQYDAKLRSEIENGDVNGDGLTNSVDAALILKYDAGLISEF